LQAWTNLSQEDKTWAEFSTLDAAMCVQHALLSEQQNCPT
jgi:hypothetical protein